jgi:hypothetical protein
MRKYLHKNRNKEYTVLGQAMLEISSSKPLREGDYLTIYHSPDGLYYARPPEEFHDGRFEEIAWAPEKETI